MVLCSLVLNLCLQRVCLVVQRSYCQQISAGIHHTLHLNQSIFSLFILSNGLSHSFHILFITTEALKILHWRKKFQFKIFRHLMSHFCIKKAQQELLRVCTTNIRLTLEYYANLSHFNSVLFPLRLNKPEDKIRCRSHIVMLHRDLVQSLASWVCCRQETQDVG